MAFIDCIQGKVDKKILTRNQGEQLQKEYDFLLNQHRAVMGNDQAEGAAVEMLIATKAKILAEKKRNAINAAFFQENIAKEFEEQFGKIKNNKGILTRPFSWFTDDSYGTIVRNFLEKVYARQQTVTKQNFYNLDKFADEYRTKWAGFARRKDGIREITLEMGGINTGNAEAKQMAQALRRTYDIALERYKAAGGIIGKLENYHPQVHSRQLIKKVSREQWIDDLRKELDISRMIDFETGLPMSEGKLRRQMEEDYDNIISNGYPAIVKAAAEGKQSLPNRGTEIDIRKNRSRFYHFKDNEAFLRYNDKYGVGDDGLYDLHINHIRSLSRDTAILEMMGPHPNGLMRHIDLQMKAHKVKFGGRAWTKGMYEIASGYVDTSVEDSWWSSAIGNANNIFSAAYLGTASISAIPDSATIKITAKINGLNPTRALKRYLKLMDPTSSADRQLAIRSGYIAELARGKTWAESRFTGENLGGKATSMLANATNRLSSLNAMTQAARNAIAFEMEASLAELVTAGTKWNALDKNFRELLEEFGVNESDFSLLSKAETFQPKEGIHFLRSVEIAKVGAKHPELAKQAMDVANKIDDAIAHLRDMASNEPSLRTRAITTGAIIGDARRGTILRAFSNSVWMFKSFFITSFFNHLLPSVKKALPALEGDFKNAQFYHLGMVAVGMSLLGMVSLQLEQGVKGKDFMDMSDWKSWAAAIAKGGGLGIFGDFLFADYSRNNSHLLSTMAGPLASFMDQFVRASYGNLQRGIEDDTGKWWDKFKRDMFTLAKYNTPANNLWYSRLVVERFIFDNIERLLDPQFDQRARQYERRLFKNTGQEFYWRKGKNAPSRAPREAERRR